MRLLPLRNYIRDTDAEIFAFNRKHPDAWIQTYTGRKYWPLEPYPDDICIEDVAHALSNKCRFGGSCRTFYSVAQHATLVSLILPEETGEAFYGLHHDDEEAHLPDIARPVKWFFNELTDVEEKNSIAMYQAFGVNTSLDYKSIKHADNVLLVTEHRDLMDNPLNPLNWKETDLKPADFKIEPASPKEAEKMFLERHYYLKSL